VTALSHRVGISIPTRDRWDDLEVTLTSLQERGYSTLETIVIDDGSSAPMPAGFAERFPWVRFIRSEKPEGACAQRNRIARLLTAPLILSLDDDSFPVAGSLEAACDWMDARPRVFSLSFQIVYRHETPPENFASRRPFPVRDFIGCAALLRREMYLALGGYEEKFIFFGEEPELCVRAMQRGFEVEGYPGFVIQHNVSPVRRDLGKRASLLIRRESLVALLFFPFPHSFRRVLLCVPGFLYRNPEFRPHWRALLVGLGQGIRDYFSGQFHRTRLTAAEFWAWKSVPIAPHVLMGLEAAGAKDFL
jgi:GT2 family glycosyltransferase